MICWYWFVDLELLMIDLLIVDNVDWYWFADDLLKLMICWIIIIKDIGYWWFLVDLFGYDIKINALPILLL